MLFLNVEPTTSLSFLLLFSHFSTVIRHFSAYFYYSLIKNSAILISRVLGKNGCHNRSHLPLSITHRQLLQPQISFSYSTGYFMLQHYKRPITLFIIQYFTILYILFTILFIQTTIISNQMKRRSSSQSM